MNLARLLKHLLVPHWVVNRAFPPRVLAAIEAAIAASEKSHDGELQFAVEVALHHGAQRRFVDHHARHPMRGCSRADCGGGSVGCGDAAAARLEPFGLVAAADQFGSH